MRLSGMLIAAVLLITAAILFAPRAGHERFTPAAPFPDALPPPDEPPLSPSPRAERVDLRPLFDQIPADDLLESMPDDAWRKLEHARRFEHYEGSRARYETIATWLRETTDHADRLHADRSYREAWRIITNRRLSPVLKDREFVTATRPPWLVFVEKGEGAQEFADRSAANLIQLSDEIHRLVGKRFGLPRIVDAPYEAERVLTVTVFKDQREFRDHFIAIGQRDRADYVTFYLHHSDGSFAFRKAGLAEDIACGRLLYSGAHQVLEVLTKIRMELDRPDEGELTWAGRGMNSKLHWFREGLAGYLASNAVAPDGTVSFGRPDRDGLAVWQERRLKEKDEWPLATLLKVASRRMMMAKAFEIGLTPREATGLARLFAFQSGLFFHFLWNHDNPKYRERLLEYLGYELRGGTGYKSWVRVWGEGKRDGSELAEEFEAWLQARWKE